MANLPETPQWEEGVYQIEVSDPVLGGPDGISNRQAKQLASRTSYLKQQVEKGGSDLEKHIAAADPHTQYAPKASPTFTGNPAAPTVVKTDNSTKLATTAHVKTVVADYAPLASPGLTGIPTAPTAAQTVNNTQLATTAFVKAALAALVASSPAALDTLNELAAALGNDPNFATTMTNALAGKQPLDNTLTALSGKSVAALLEYLGLGDAAKKGIATNAEMQVGTADK
ncbi:phage tail protein, partial [Yersinia enterocolitica]